MPPASNDIDLATSDGPRLVTNGPRLVTNGVMAETSTDGSDEELLRSGPTLSFTIVQFHPFRPVLYFLALNLEYRKEHVCGKLVKLLSLR